MAEKKNWAAGAFKNAHGQLHEQLDVDPKKPIPKQKLMAAARGRYGSLAKKRAMPVVNVQK
jgi:hypothetical protein